MQYSLVWQTGSGKGYSDVIFTLSTSKYRWQQHNILAGKGEEGGRKGEEGGRKERGRGEGREEEGSRSKRPGWGCQYGNKILKYHFEIKNATDPETL